MAAGAAGAALAAYPLGCVVRAALRRLRRDRLIGLEGLGAAIAEHCAREALAAAEYERVAWDNGRGAFWFDPDRYRVPWNKWTLEKPLSTVVNRYADWEQYQAALQNSAQHMAALGLQNSAAAQQNYHGRFVNIHRPQNYARIISDE